MRIDSAGKVGIGASSIDGNSNLQIQNDSGNALLRLRSGTSNLSGVDFGDSGDIDIGGIRYSNSSNHMQFNVNAAERMRIDSTGAVLIGKTTTATSVAGIRLSNDGFTNITRNGAECVNFNRLTSDGVILDFRKDSTTVGSIGTFASDITIGKTGAGLRFEDGTQTIRPHNVSTNLPNNANVTLGSSDTRFKDLYLSGAANVGSVVATGNVTAYSDSRLKENVEVISNAVSKVQQLSGNTYTRNDLEDTNKKYAGVIAQEVEAVLPEAVSTTPDGTKVVDYNATIALLVEAVKELKAEVDSLKGGE